MGLIGDWTDGMVIFPSESQQSSCNMGAGDKGIRDKYAPWCEDDRSGCWIVVIRYVLNPKSAISSSLAALVRAVEANSPAQVTKIRPARVHIILVWHMKPSVAIS